MVTSQLISYIRSLLQKGVSRENIHRKLVLAKWDEADINNATIAAQQQDGSYKSIEQHRSGKKRIFLYLTASFILLGSSIGLFMWLKTQVNKSIYNHNPAQTEQSFSEYSPSSWQNKQSLSSDQISASQIKPTIIISAPTEAQYDSDPIVSCQIGSECQSKKFTIRQSQCNLITCCPIYDQWFLLSRADCQIAQANIEEMEVKDTKRQIQAQINQQLYKAQSDYYSYMSENYSPSFGVNYSNPLFTSTKNADSVPILGKGTYYTDSLGITYYHGNNGQSATIYTDSLGMTYVLDTKGNTVTSWTDSLGTTHTQDTKGNYIYSSQNSIGAISFNGIIGGTPYTGEAKTDGFGNVLYFDNWGQKLTCSKDSLGMTTCY